MATSTSDHCLIQKEAPEQQELGIGTAKQGGKQSNNCSEGKVRIGGRKEWEIQKGQPDANLVMLQTGDLIQVGEVKASLQHRLEEIQVSLQTGVNLLQGVIESSNSQMESAVEEVSSTVTSVETTLQNMDSTLTTINSNLLELQETVEFGLKELTKEIASLVKWLCQNLSAEPVEHQSVKPFIRTAKTVPI
ncbi:uncharacterized protein LOC119961755 isoform X2 [Scyliorhinus canicula]|uniref:uncharacterized protein LOC119961755 isoform X2 n=1 Tax=Scyliorhinus canicula TaxID=7830 RepID=UPI0018F74227|nr:uncharacterized protein LOC119961755 isoform X2 [Scyliorhinus canicula]XP_038644960.1 uncharacterized protein LOC119961755 isoform X2 [Scyliorhinus canicula]XP_038644970.1 uncharacterized protein LOC119961755 isoform X2 [Scyliorhinus canicula]XP_038644980.1 uncharacterized protein LOC119961755 isoform X2 [Scyliorhinus canicula]